MEEVILGIRVGHGRARVGWVEVFFSLSNLTCRDRPHPPQARALGNLLHSGLALARPPLRSSPRINLQKLCYTALNELVIVQLKDLGYGETTGSLAFSSAKLGRMPQNRTASSLRMFWLEWVCSMFVPRCPSS